MGQIKRWCSAGLAADGTTAMHGRSFARAGGPRTLADDSYVWDVQACPEAPTTYVCTDLGVTGGSDDGEMVITGEDYETLCDRHTDEAKRRPGWAWSRPLSLFGGEAA